MNACHSFRVACDQVTHHFFMDCISSSLKEPLWSIEERAKIVMKSEKSAQFYRNSILYKVFLIAKKNGLFRTGFFSFILKFEEHSKPKLNIECDQKAFLCRSTLFLHLAVHKCSKSSHALDRIKWSECKRMLLKANCAIIRQVNHF